MNENLNLVELLKDCPKGTKFYSRCLGSVEFCKITLDNYIEVIGKNGYYIGFKPNGTYQHSEESAEIDLFPSKDQRDWSKWHRPFVDGDIITYMFWRKPTTYIYRENGTHNTSYYVAYSSGNNKLYTDAKGALSGNRHDLRFATEEEKQKLFDVLKKEGYEWDAEKKELKTLQLFKDGDIVATNDGKYIAIIENNGGKYYVCCHPNVNYFHIDRSGWFDRLATEEEKATLFQAIKDNGYKWNAETKTLEKLILPKFKVGDKIRHRLTGNVYMVLCVLSNGYGGGVYNVAVTNEIGKSINIEEQDNYELLPNKFDPKTLKPFDKVLVRDFSNQKWTACLFSHIDNDAYHQFKTSTALGWYHCIPFNEDTKHLVGKMDEAPEFYRYWEE